VVELRLKFLLSQLGLSFSFLCCLVASLGSMTCLVTVGIFEQMMIETFLSIIILDPCEGKANWLNSVDAHTVMTYVYTKWCANINVQTIMKDCCENGSQISSASDP
jgi:hypothetical protein